jgi:hypothetical protein
MQKPKNAFEIFTLLEKSNCGNCAEKTCLAFAGAVFTGRRQLGECPRLARDVVARYGGGPAQAGSAPPEGAAFFEELKARIAGTDLRAAAARLGGSFSQGRLTLKVLGKDFSVDPAGGLHAEIHVNPWVAIPFFSHVLYGKGTAPAGRWVSFRELKDGRERYPLFQKRCEEALKGMADTHTELFDDMVRLFGGRAVAPQFESDISVVLHPLPRVPVMICYWLPEAGMQSSLNILFDETADDNLGIGAVFSLGAGLAQMFCRLAERHGTPWEARHGPTPIKPLFPPTSNRTSRNGSQT